MRLWPPAKVAKVIRAEAEAQPFRKCGQAQAYPIAARDISLIGTRHGRIIDQNLAC